MLFRRGRAALMIATLWAAFWGAEGLLLGVGKVLRRSHYPGFSEPVLWWSTWGPSVMTYVVAWATAGGIAGLTFAVMLAALERGRTADTLSRGRVTLWGATAVSVLLVQWLARTLHGQEATIGAPTLQTLASLLVLFTLGGACAWLTIALTKSRVTPSPELGQSVTQELPGFHPLDASISVRDDVAVR